MQQCAYVRPAPVSRDAGVSRTAATPGGEVVELDEPQGHGLLVGRRAPRVRRRVRDGRAVHRRRGRARGGLPDRGAGRCRGRDDAGRASRWSATSSTTTVLMRGIRVRTGGPSCASGSQCDRPRSPASGTRSSRSVGPERARPGVGGVPCTRSTTPASSRAPSTGSRSFMLMHDSVPAQAVATGLALPGLRWVGRRGARRPGALLPRRARRDRGRHRAGRARARVPCPQRSQSGPRVGTMQFAGMGAQYRYPIGYDAYLMYVRDVGAALPARDRPGRGGSRRGRPRPAWRTRSTTSVPYKRRPLTLDEYLASPFVVEPYPGRRLHDRGRRCVRGAGDVARAGPRSAPPAGGRRVGRLPRRAPGRVSTSATTSCGTTTRATTRAGCATSCSPAPGSARPTCRSPRSTTASRAPSSSGSRGSASASGAASGALRAERRHARPAARFPVNTHGGLLAEGYLHGMNTVAEAVLQVQGAGRRPSGAAPRRVRGHVGRARWTVRRCVLDRRPLIPRASPREPGDPNGQPAVELGDVTITRVVEMIAPVPPPGCCPGRHRRARAQPLVAAAPLRRRRRQPRALDPRAVRRVAGRKIVVDTCVGNDRVIPEYRGADARHAVPRRPRGGGLRPRRRRHRHLHAPALRPRRVEHDARRRRVGPDVPERAVRHLPRRMGALVDSEGESGYARTLDDAVRPVVDAGLVDLRRARSPVTDEIRLEPTPGHTPGHVAVHIESNGEHAFITGDAGPPPGPVRRAGVGREPDTDPGQSTATRQRLLAEYADTGTSRHRHPLRAARAPATSCPTATAGGSGPTGPDPAGPDPAGPDPAGPGTPAAPGRAGGLCGPCRWGRGGDVPTRRISSGHLEAARRARTWAARSPTVTGLPGATSTSATSNSP